MKDTKDNSFVLAIYVDNKAGVLTRVTSMFTRRGFNIDALTVGVTESPDYSRITISMSGDGYARAQMINQLRKLYNVKKVEILDENDSIERELLLIKVQNNSQEHQLLLSSIDIFKAKIIDYSTESFSLEVTGNSDKIDAFIEMVRPVGIIESCRTGVVALSKGSGSLLGKPDCAEAVKILESCPHYCYTFFTISRTDTCIVRSVFILYTNLLCKEIFIMAKENRIFYEKDCDVSKLDGKTVAVIGYGSQGHAHALNLKDSGVDVIVGLYEGSKSWKKAEDQGLKVYTTAEAAKRADIIMILINDEKQAAMYKKDIAPNLKEGDTVAFAHGFNIHYGCIKVPDNVNVMMIAPKAPGHTVRSEYLAGKGTPMLIAVEQDYSGDTWDVGLAYAAAIGGARCRLVLTPSAKLATTRETLTSSASMR